MLDLHHAFLLSPIPYNFSATISYISKLTISVGTFGTFVTFVTFLLIKKRKAQKG